MPSFRGPDRPRRRLRSATVAGSGATARSGRAPTAASRGSATGCGGVRTAGGTRRSTRSRSQRRTRPTRPRQPRALRSRPGRQARRSDRRRERARRTARDPRPPRPRTAGWLRARRDRPPPWVSHHVRTGGSTRRDERPSRRRRPPRRPRTRRACPRGGAAGPGPRSRRACGGRRSRRRRSSSPRPARCAGCRRTKMKQRSSTEAVVDLVRDVERDPRRVLGLLERELAADRSLPGVAGVVEPDRASRADEPIHRDDHRLREVERSCCSTGRARRSTASSSPTLRPGRASGRCRPPSG